MTKEVKGFSFEQFAESGYLSGANASYLEMLYDQYLDDPAGVPALHPKPRKNRIKARAIPVARLD